MNHALEVRNLTKSFGETIAVNDIGFSADIGEVIALLGPNGAGKSTLMNLITGYLTPDFGEIKILNQDISIFSKQNIGFLPEGAPIYPDMSVRMFLNYMAELRDIKKSRIDEVIKIAKIEKVVNQKVETLSKGYLRRVGFAQSILSEPKILLLDEPTDGLDPNQKEHIRELISKMGKNKLIMISTHLLDEAETIANRIIIINQGKILIDGTCDEILKKTKTKTLEDAFKKLTSPSRHCEEAKPTKQSHKKTGEKKNA